MAGGGQPCGCGMHDKQIVQAESDSELAANACKACENVIKWKNVATEWSESPGVICIRDFLNFPGTDPPGSTRLRNLAAEFARKGMMKDGAESRRVTIFIVKHYGVIYRL